ncbi:bifunctional adenosylcobinamide kinase/adenosylcobinamide-phosphate guanylyltransferase [Phormidium tenue]|uniref:Adenosylcobinamide kinase n=1 Tax=Phormidium tenue NIES-30 TaxID=549789 RepID=A0A1U7J323_9CYAN|nr:bifunctional adenosylcobinamide kinase/adenosylcobinamide-phosphate guanylyltransferase [Phormidium tenue]MBD2233230.1 bifunctional adenosylcobinamide kinase/adenosylcobinamide-phosphate guanylyltransferase [Phormidium tenue FACHB-1052]OKH46594.1 bifunctional adenosylcobinamide kinase/adenosylcobinamide-phosphate guanylyltransferase [Phormidium tenue NIES-30]
MTTNHRISLVTGPARSGKSEWAEALATNSGQAVIYIATSNVDPADLDWQKRVDLHRDRRPAHWQLQEVPIALPEAIRSATAQDCLLIDSLGTWLANLLEQDDATWQTTVNSLVESLWQTPSTVILVSEETGWGVVPAYPIGRLFRDRLGSLTRQVGTVAGAVYLVVAGYAVDVKALGKGLGSRE